MSKSADRILYGGTIVTMNTDFDIIVDGALAIKDDKIVAIGQSDSILAKYKAKETVEFTDQVMIPGLVNSHTHIPMSLLRGLNDDLRLDVWLGYLMPVEREFVTPEFVKLGARLACAEMIRSGVTTFADMYYFEEAIAEETAVIGMRGLLGQTVLLFPAPDAATYEDALVLCRQFIERWNGHPLIQPAVAPHAWYTATPDLMQACADLAKAYDVPLHTHVAETALEVETARRDHHMRVVPWIEQSDILETKLLAAHCVHIDESEMFMLKEAQAGVAHCPTSNLKLASGIAQIGRMVQMEMNVGIGTDGPASNNDLDMFEETRLAAILAKTANNDPTVLPARQALELATIGGAKAVHLSHLTGSLVVSKRADLALIQMDGVHNQPHFKHNPDAVYSRLVYSAKSSDVTDVMCNGRWLMRHQQLLTIDEENTKQEAAKIAAKIDAFVKERESSPYNKLVLLSGVKREESFEVQVKIPIEEPDEIIKLLQHPRIEIKKKTRYKQYDHYFIFDGNDPDAARLRYREDVAIDDQGQVKQTRTRLTLLGDTDRQELPNAAMLSRSRYLAPADRSLRFYREYFAPPTEVAVVKERKRWRILFKETEYAINIDKLIEPAVDGYFLEIKSRTWSRTDAMRKSTDIGELLVMLNVDINLAEKREYGDIV